MFLVCVFFSAQFFFGQELKPNLGAFGIESQIIINILITVKIYYFEPKL